MTAGRHSSPTDPEVAAHASGQSRTALVSIAAASFLVLLKLGTGVVTGSLGLISAGIESSGDVVAALMTYFAIRVGGRPADEMHHYGHRRAENLGALGEAAILLGGGVFIVVEAIGQLTAGGGHGLEARWYIFVVIGVALSVDISRIAVSVRSARRYRSAALRSNAFHFAGDMAGTLAVLGGMAAVAAGFEQGDAVAAIVVAGIIFAAAGRLVYENARVLMDTAPADALARAEQAITGLGDAVELRRFACASRAGGTSRTRWWGCHRGRRSSRVTARPMPSRRLSATRCRIRMSSCISSRAARASTSAIARWPWRSPSLPCARRTTSRSTSTTVASASRCISR